LNGEDKERNEDESLDYDRNRLGSFVRKREGREQRSSRRPAPYSLKTANVHRQQKERTKVSGRNEPLDAA
jgi:hypothetical protein